MCRFESKTDEQKKDVIKYHYECDLNMSKIRFPKLDSSIESQIKNGAMLVNLKSK